MEYFDILNSDGTKSGRKKERNAVHRDGDLHASMHTWMKSGNEVLLQRRAHDKESRPGCLDSASSGHVSAGEDVRTAALREVFEETGITVKPEDLAEVFRQHLDVVEDNGHGLFQSHEINTVFAVTRDIGKNEICFDPVEVSSMEWKTADEIDEAFRTDRPSVCFMPQEWAEVKAFWKL